MQCACTTLPSVPCLDKPYFSTLSHKQQDSREKDLLNIKICVLFFSIIFLKYISLYLIISHYISLCLIISHYISLYLIISHYISKERTSPHFRNTPSTTKLEGEKIVEAPGKDDNASMPEQIKRPNAWRKMMMVMMMVYHIPRSTERYVIKNVCVSSYKVSDIPLKYNET